ncbi:MAG TPA: dTMP kinase [Chthonomonadaceae bacterium]|nr:dTMP kinase [Chthonomonadaceae bacterium]
MKKVSPGTGLFLTFEGIEGAGKTTQVALLRAALIQEGWNVCVTREPGGDPIAEAVRDLVLHENMSARAELLLFLAARAENVERIILPKLDEGAIVLCDRFSDSTMAYQVAARGLNRDVVGRLNAFATHEIAPDLTFLLDLSPEIGLSRQRQGNRMEAESLEFHRRVREGYLAEAQNHPARIVIIDATADSDTLRAAILAHTQRALAQIKGARR